MLIPNTPLYVTLILALSLLCLGSWAIFQKSSSKLRFELFYYNFSVGALLLAVIAAFTLGNGGTELSFDDNLTIASKRAMAMAVMAGAVLNLGTMLLSAAASVGGVSLAFPIAVSISVLAGTLVSFLVNPQGNTAMVLGGCALLLGAIVFNAMAHGGYTKGLITAKKQKFSETGKAVALSCVSGLLLVAARPLLETAMTGGIGGGAYTRGAFTGLRGLGSR